MARANSDGAALLAMLKAQQPPTSGVQQLLQAPPSPSLHPPPSRGLPPSPLLTASSGADPRAFWDSAPGGSYAAVGLRGPLPQQQQSAQALQAQPRPADALSASLTALRLVEPQHAPAAAPNTRIVDQKVGGTALNLLRGPEANGPEPPRPALQPGPAPHPSTSGDRWRAGKTAQYRKPLKADLDLTYFLLQVSRQLFELCRTLRPSENEQRSLQQFVQHVQQLVYQEWPGVRLHPFGSYANGFTVKNSDVDLCLEVEDEETAKADHVTRLADILERNGMKDVQALTHARVPIVKFKDPQSGVACDICVNNLLAVANTRLLYTYASLDPRLKQLALIVKHWAKRRQINETYRGTLSSYAYVLMCIYFLQTRQPPVLPCLQAMEATCQGEANGVPYKYFDQVDQLKDFGHRNTETLGTLLVEFYRYWAREHDYNNHVISVRTGGPIRKEDKNWTKRVGVDRHLICIEDPFDTTHDLGRVVDKMSITVLKDEFFRALRAFENMLKPIPFLFEPYRRGQDQ
eukprot:jgi/Chlat1/4755/Chrsp308S04724